MKNLFLIDGAAGTGKTDMLSYLEEKYTDPGQVTVVRKFSTRKLRPEEAKRGLALDLDFISSQTFSRHAKDGGFYAYAYGTNQYGIERSATDQALETHENVFLIVRDMVTIQKIVSDYGETRTIPVFVYTDRDECKKRLIADGYSEEATEFRLQRQAYAWSDYLKHSDLYTETIINNSTRTDFHRLIDSLIRRYSPDGEERNVLYINNLQRFNILQPLVGFKEELRSHCVNYDRNVFLMMKFRDSNKLLSRLITEELSAFKLNCVRADQSEWNITNNVYNPLAVLYCCKYGIALFDEAEAGNSYSPNVAYELGMMQLQGKPCLILRHSSLPPMPFDLTKDVHEPYSKDLEIKEILKTWAGELDIGSTKLA